MMGMSAADAPDQKESDYRHLKALCDHFHVPGPHVGDSFFSTSLAGTCKLRWERHTEAQTYTFSREATEEELAAPLESGATALSDIPESWTAALPGTVVASMHIAMIEHKRAGFMNSVVAERQRFEWIARQFSRSSVITGASVDSGRFRVYGDFRTHSDGFGRMLVVSNMPDEAANKRSSAGKVLQRLIELEKYRVLALMGLPFAKTLAPRVDELNAALQKIMVEVGHAGQLDVAAQRRLLDELSELTATSLKLGSSSAYRCTRPRGVSSTA